MHDDSRNDLGFILQESLLPKVELLLDSAPGPARLNVLLPHVQRAHAYGGVVSALELAREASRHYRHVRFLSEAPLGGGEELFDLGRYVADPETTTVELDTIYGKPLGLHASDIFLCTYWSTATVWEAYAAELAGAGLSPNPFYYFIQDWEPGFYPFSYKHSRALNTYSHAEHTCAVFNSEQLADYVRGQGLRFAQEITLRPSLNPDLHAYLAEHRFVLPPKPADELFILVYGRPRQQRNCFACVVDGVSRYLATKTEAERERIRVISVGAPDGHEDIMLMPEGVIKGMGKLPLDKYVSFLAFSHVGVSFMVSPHPSYPPLEMATFGLYTITNSYKNKDISGSHENIHSLPTPDPALLAAELARAEQWVRANRGKPVAAKTPGIMDQRPWRDNVAACGLPRLNPANGETA